jgi:hypothetical protein
VNTILRLFLIAIGLTLMLGRKTKTPIPMPEYPPTYH